jgi:hypothetical protein
MYAHHNNNNNKKENTNTKRTGTVTQGLEHCPSKYEVLNSNLSTVEKNNKRTLASSGDKEKEVSRVCNIFFLGIHFPTALDKPPKEDIFHTDLV